MGDGTCLYIRVRFKWHSACIPSPAHRIASRARSLCTVHSVHTAQYHYVTNFSVSCRVYVSVTDYSHARAWWVPFRHFIHIRIRKYVHRAFSQRNGHIHRRTAVRQHHKHQHTQSARKIYFITSMMHEHDPHTYIIDNGVELLRAFKKNEKKNRNSHTNAIEHVLCVPSQCGCCAHAHTIFTLKWCTQCAVLLSPVGVHVSVPGIRYAEMCFVSQVWIAPDTLCTFRAHHTMQNGHFYRAHERTTPTTTQNMKMALGKMRGAKQKKQSKKTHTLKINMISVLMKNIDSKDTRQASHSHALTFRNVLFAPERIRTPTHSTRIHTSATTNGYGIPVDVLRYYLGGHKLRHQRHADHTCMSCSRTIFYFTLFFLPLRRSSSSYPTRSYFLLYLVFSFLCCSFPTWKSCCSHFLVKMSMVWWATSIDSYRRTRNSSDQA